MRRHRSGDSRRIEREDERVVLIRPSTALEEVVTIRKTDIRQRALSRTSNMPTGIVNTLDEAKVLDLLAYLISDSDSDQAAFHSSAASIPATK